MGRDSSFANLTTELRTAAKTSVTGSRLLFDNRRPILPTACLMTRYASGSRFATERGGGGRRPYLSDDRVCWGWDRDPVFGGSRRVVRQTSLRFNSSAAADDRADRRTQNEPSDAAARPRRRSARIFTIRLAVEPAVLDEDRRRVLARQHAAGQEHVRHVAFECRRVVDRHARWRDRPRRRRPRADRNRRDSRSAGTRGRPAGARAGRATRSTITVVGGSRRRGCRSARRSTLPRSGSRCRASPST